MSRLPQSPPIDGSNQALMLPYVSHLKVRELKYNRHRNVELDNILLIVAQSGLYIFTIFSVIGAQFFVLHQNTKLVLLNATACLLQATLQTIFILDASRRIAMNKDQSDRKPGREMITFLLVCNFAMWAINTLETRRADSNPVQMHFYGFWAWTIITHVTTPLTIFYRFHSTVCLCDIWKRIYKRKVPVYTAHLYDPSAAAAASHPESGGQAMGGTGPTTGMYGDNIEMAAAKSRVGQAVSFGRAASPLVDDCSPLSTPLGPKSGTLQRSALKSASSPCFTQSEQHNFNVQIH